MSEHHAKVHWQANGLFSHEQYNKEHQAELSGHVLPMASANTPGFCDPEQALAASLASCHMLTFLALAAKKRLVVDTYDDDPVATVGQLEDGRYAVTKIELFPKVSFANDSAVTNDALQKMHEKAHHHCFVSNGLSCEVVIHS